MTQVFVGLHIWPAMDQGCWTAFSRAVGNPGVKAIVRSQQINGVNSRVVGRETGVMKT